MDEKTHTEQKSSGYIGHEKNVAPPLLWNRFIHSYIFLITPPQDDLVRLSEYFQHCKYVMHLLTFKVFPPPHRIHTSGIIGIVLALFGVEGFVAFSVNLFGYGA